MSNQSSTTKLSFPISSVWIAKVFTSFSGGKETKVFADLEDAKTWSERRRAEITGNDMWFGPWTESQEGIHYLAGSLFGAVQIEPHTVNYPRKKTECLDFNGLWIPIPKCCIVLCANKADGTFVAENPSVHFLGCDYICAPCAGKTKGTFRMFGTGSLR